MAKNRQTDVVSSEIITKGGDQMIEVAAAALPTLNTIADPAAIAALMVKIEPNLAICRSITIVRTDDERAKASLVIDMTKPMAKTLDKVRREVNRRFQEQINGRFQPHIATINEALEVVEGARRAYDAAVLEKARAEQAEKDRQAAAERAELARRQKIQDAAVAAGKQAITTIPAPETVQAEIVANPNANQGNKMYYRLRAHYDDINAMPDEYVVKQPNYSKVNAMMAEIEATVDKERRGIDDVESTIPGVRFVWEPVYR